MDDATDNESLKFNFNDGMFGFDGTVHVYVTDVIGLMKEAWLNVLIIHIFCCKYILTLTFLTLMFNYNNDIFICMWGSSKAVHDI
jgi:hypothetical protein